MCRSTARPGWPPPGSSGPGSTRWRPSSATRTPGGEVVHADCGDGGLVLALSQSGTPARGVEPRGAVALRALEHGADVTISEVSEYLADLHRGLARRPRPQWGHRPPAPPWRHSAAGASPACAWRPAPLSSWCRRLRRARRTASRSRTIWSTGASLHSQTWGLLLERSGFVDVDVDGLAAQPPRSTSDDQRFGVTATTPST